MITLTRYKPDPNTYRPGFDAFTSNLGFIIYGIFTFICVTVLINTLIAMLERTIEQIDDRADVEWKFARSQLYMEYIRDGKYRFSLNKVCNHSKTLRCENDKYFYDFIKKNQSTNTELISNELCRVSV